MYNIGTCVRNHFFVVCINVNVQDIQCFSLKLSSLTIILEKVVNLSTLNYVKTVSADAIESDCCCNFSFYVLSFHLWLVFPNRLLVIDNTGYRFFAICLFALPQSSCHYLYVCLGFSCKITVRQASPSYILSYYLAKLNPILIHYRTIPYLNTLPN